MWNIKRLGNLGSSSPSAPSSPFSTMCLAKHITDKPRQEKHQKLAAAGDNVPDKANAPNFTVQLTITLTMQVRWCLLGTECDGPYFPLLIRFPTCPEETSAKNKPLFLFQSLH